jgi:hypothetical protein
LTGFTANFGLGTLHWSHSTCTVHLLLKIQNICYIESLRSTTLLSYYNICYYALNQFNSCVNKSLNWMPAKVTKLYIRSNKCHLMCVCVSINSSEHVFKKLYLKLGIRTRRVKTERCIQYLFLCHCVILQLYNLGTRWRQV